MRVESNTGRVPTVGGGYYGPEIDFPLGWEKGEITDTTEPGEIRRERLCQRSPFVSGENFI